MYKILLLLCLHVSMNAFSQQLSYPYPVQILNVKAEGRDCRMAYMDVTPQVSNGHTVVLLHGKNFNGYYWKDVIPSLTQAGYRVIVPDQLGWGLSDKPVIDYSFLLLATLTKTLLDTLGIDKIELVAHSMGGMLATRFTVMYPGVVEKLVLENPIGLEDYSLFVPYQSTDKLFSNEQKATYASMKKYQQSYYPEWKPEYEPYVKAQEQAFLAGNKDSNALVNALTYQMIYEQPTVYYLDRITAPVLLVIGQADRTIVGKELLSSTQQQQYGQYPQLGKWAQSKIYKAELAEIPATGHIPHIQMLQLYLKYVLTFLQK